MTPSRLALCTLSLTLLCLRVARADQPPAKPAEPPKADAKLPMTGLAPAPVLPNVCVLHYRVSTASPECQALFDQGLGFYYSYVWMEAARSFETAARRDPDCAMAWWGLSRALEKWSKSNHNQALEKAQALLPRASDRERFLITARLQEKGLVAGVTPDMRKKAAVKSIDELLTLYDDDTEGWYARAQLSDGGADAVPFYKALLRLDPLHPGANHELLHYYDNTQRPALGWVYAENYIKSSPGIPHPFHMQAHLATRLGRWDRTSDRSARAIELERAYHKEMHVAPHEDYQFPHHLEVLTLSLIHDGRFQEARKIEAESRGNGYRFWLPWFRLHLAERDWDAARKLLDDYRKSDRDKLTASYLAALLYLRQGDAGRARPEVEVLREAYQKNKNDRQLEFRVWETQGLLQCQTGDGDAGLKLLAKAVERSKKDYRHHEWGNGAYYMEAWGVGALAAGQADAAEEAFQEALAHDPGSVRGALGLQVLCERQGRTDEAGRYAELARRCWRHADAGRLDAELAELKKTFPTNIIGD
jgi:tetratricopeptide (TPR) repeat protein